MNKAVFLDRDGTINVEKNYLYDIEEFEFLPQVFEALKILQDAGYLLIIVTNQSGIGRGFYSEEDFAKLNQWMLGILEKHGIQIQQVYYCPHHPKALIKKYRKDCECRKPNIGMYLNAVKDFQIALEKSYVIGDKIRDCAVCKTTECRGFLIENNEKKEIIEAVKRKEYLRVGYAKNLYDAALKITNSESREKE